MLPECCLQEKELEQNHGVKKRGYVKVIAYIECF